MVDEKKIIKKLEKRIDAFQKEHPEESKDCVSIATIREFIHMLELEAKENKESEMEEFRKQLTRFDYPPTVN